MQFIKNLEEIAKSDVAIAGGKGASLGEMTKAGIPVPRGFVILSRSFQHFIQKTGLQVEIDAAFDTINPEEMHTLENASEKIQAGIIDGEIPLYIKKEIEDSFKRLKCKFVAVRSSATAEDSMDAAWAGQLNSYLNTTQRDLLENIKKCWASLFTPRALFYRFEKKLQDREISVAVIIQEMINSEKSGIAFSVHPVTQDKNQLIIEAGFGLGEAIVSGQITPDSCVVDKQTWKILEKKVHTQSKAMYRNPRGGNEWRTLGKRGKKQVLYDKDIVRIAQLIVKIEKHYGFPVDVEFALEGKKVYIVQSRPITTLMKEDTSIENKFGLEFTRERGDAFLENEGISLSDIKKHTLADRFMEKMEGQELSPPMYNSTLFVQTSGWNVKKYFQKYYSDRTSFPLLITMNADEGIMYIPATKIKKLSEEIFKKYWADESIIIEIFKEYRTKTKTIDKIYGQITHDFLEKNNFEELVPYAELIKDAAWDMNAVVFFSIFFDKEMCSDLLKRVKSKISRERLDDLWDKAIDPIFDSFEKRREYYLLNLLKRGLDLDEISEKCQYFYANYSEIFSIKEVRRKIKKKLTQFEDRRELEKFLIKEQEKKNEIIKKHNLWVETLSPEEKKLVHYLQMIMELRDDRKDYLAKLLTVVFKIAEKLFDDNGLDKKYIYFYMFDEIVKGNGYLIKNKDLLEKRMRGCSVLVDYDGEKYIWYENFDETKEKLEKFFLNQQKMGNKIIKGNPAYPGKVKGVVKIITNLAIQSRDFKKGDILVTGMTRPEFVPLMKKASAVITDEGGVTSHAAIVSREMKIPCVIGTKIATSVLKDGMLIEVDADRGIVRIIKR